MRAREFLSEDEYDDGAGQFGQNPNMLKVNADQYLHTYPTYRYLELGKKENYGELPLEEKKMWEARAIKLQARAQRIYNQIKAEMPPEERTALNGVKVWIPLDGETSYARASFTDREITLDVGCFWDLSDDCLAYTIGHEIGHMVWAFGPQKNWSNSKIKNPLANLSASQNRQLEMDADVYGALLAYRLGYDRRKAFDHFTIAYQRTPFRSGDTYPSVPQRRDNVEKAIKSQADKAAQPPQAAPAAQPDTGMAEKNVWLQHIMNGMQKFDTALANNPEMAVA
jgi:hypothetical protein